MFLPVQILTAIEHQGTQGGQCVAGLFAPMHPLMLLSSGHNQAIFAHPLEKVKIANTNLIVFSYLLL
jgi:hypothetical protein